MQLHPDGSPEVPQTAISHVDIQDRHILSGTIQDVLRPTPSISKQHQNKLPALPRKQHRVWSLDQFLRLLIIS